jgi:hexokinase
MSQATLMAMGKGFAITSNLDLGNMLLKGYSRHCEEPTSNGYAALSPTQRHFKKRKISYLPRIKIAAITNDTVATFVSLAYLVKAAPNSRTAMGLIVGTGCNATVPMKISDIHPEKRKSSYVPAEAKENATIVINTEWTIKGTDTPMKELKIPTAWDVELDQNSELPGFQPFEYMTAGRYLGEIVRLAFVDIVTSETPGMELPAALLKKNSITTTFLATTVACTDERLLSEELLNVFPPPENGKFEWNHAMTTLIKRIAKDMQVRASALIAAAVVGLLTCVGDIALDEAPIAEPLEKAKSAEMNYEELVVAYTGRTIALYPDFLEDCQKWIDKLVSFGSPLNASKSVVLKDALDGGIIGAAVLAGVGVTHSKSKAN